MRNFNTEHKERIRTIFKCPETYRKEFRPFDGSGDISFLATWPNGASKIFDLIETTCFMHSGHDDSTIKVGLKCGKTAQEILEGYQPWKAAIEEIDTALQQENAVATVLGLKPENNPWRSCIAIFLSE